MGTGGAIAKRTGGTWALQASSATTALTSVYSTAADHAVAVGSSNEIEVWNGATWTTSAATLPGTSGTDVYGSSSGSYWIIAGGVLATTLSLRHFDGTALTTCTTCDIPGAGGGGSVHGIAANDIWAASTTILLDIAGVATNVRVTFVHYDGADWVPTQVLDVTGTAGTSSVSLWMASSTRGFAALSDILIEYDGVAWTQVVMPPTTERILGVWGSAGTDVWAVGNVGTIIHRGTAWTMEPSTTTADLQAVWCLDAANCWNAGEGGIIQKLQVNPAVAVPSLVGLQWDPGDLIAHTSEAQCLGDETTLGVNLEPSLGAGGFTNYVLNSNTGVVVEQIPSASFFNLNNKHLHTSRLYPPGEYSFLVVADVTGLLAPDNWAAETFSVPVGSCLDAGQDGSLEELTDQHFDQDLLHPGAGGGGGLIPLSNFPGIALDDSTGIFLLFILMLWALTQGFFWLGGTALVGILATWLGSLDPGGDYDGGTGFAIALALVLLAAWMEAMIRGYRLRRGGNDSGS